MISNRIHQNVLYAMYVLHATLEEAPCSFGTFDKLGNREEQMTSWRSSC